MAPQATADLYRAQQRRILATLGLVRREWAGMGSEFDASWATVGRRVAVLTTAAQLGAARDGAAYVQAVAGGTSTPVVPSSLAGVASDGRPLASLLDAAVIEAKRGMASGLSVPDALERGRKRLDMVVHTQVADAARDASSLGVTARPRTAWVRMVNPPCCQRCAVLAGKVFQFNEGFKRHPRCDCTHQVIEAGANYHPPRELGAGDVTDLTAKQRQAIEGGADFNQVINEYNRKGAYHLPPTRVDKITAAAPSREQAVEALQQAGYLAA